MRKLKVYGTTISCRKEDKHLLDPERTRGESGRRLILKFHDWLKKIKGLSDEEIEKLGFNPRKYMRVSKQYLKWKEDND